MFGAWRAFVGPLVTGPLSLSWDILCVCPYGLLMLGFYYFLNMLELWKSLLSPGSIPRVSHTHSTASQGLFPDLAAMPGSGIMDHFWFGTQLSLSTLPESQSLLGWGMSSPSMFLHLLYLLHFSNTPSSYFQKLVEFSMVKYIFAFPGALSWELSYKVE